MASFYRRIFRPVWNQFLTKVPGKKSMGQFARVAFDLMVPGRTIYPDVVVVMTTHCSLKCKNCNNLIPCYEEPYHIPAGELIKDIDTLLSHTDTCLKIQLMGGEPFVYPYLPEVLDYLKGHPKIMSVGITTNGTIIPKAEVLEKIAALPCKNIAISDYGLPQQKIKELCRTLKKYGISYHRSYARTWADPGGVECRNKSLKQLSKEYNSCFSSRYCRTMLNGKLFLCARSASLFDLGYMESSHDAFDIRLKRTDGEFRRELRNFFLKDYAEACNYCDHYLKKKIKAGEQKQENS